MSSIYRKGRDGYFYYQTYVFNPETKKRDKRIFHALRTKDSTEAEAMQNELDLKYKKESYIDSNISNTSNVLLSKTKISIFFGLTITILFYYLIPNKLENNFRSPTVTMESSPPEQEIKVNNEIHKATQKQDNITETNIDPIPKVNKKKLIIPEYTIERIERLSGAFEQGKLYVTIKKTSSKESQLLLCEELRNRFSEFSNMPSCSKLWAILWFSRKKLHQVKYESQSS